MLGSAHIPATTSRTPQGADRIGEISGLPQGQELLAQGVVVGEEGEPEECWSADGASYDVVVDGRSRVRFGLKVCWR
ncbi:hypothetical protein CGZ69_00245 [Streptomyces peucetius subsp. caesius ATCC 27952]|nr:hypothetical protein CGZ69_00245 [Streptomyces peucetius subsp. caesius ATCC 27952]